jgi:hypothetical protein
LYCKNEKSRIQEPEKTEVSREEREADKGTVGLNL